VDDPTPDVLPDEGSDVFPLAMSTFAGALVCEHAAAVKVAATPARSRIPARIT